MCLIHKSSGHFSCVVDAAGDERDSQIQETESVRGPTKWSSWVYRQLSEVRRVTYFLCWKMFIQFKLNRPIYVKKSSSSYDSPTQESPVSPRVSDTVWSLLLHFFCHCETPPQRNASHLHSGCSQQSLLLSSGTCASSSSYQCVTLLQPRPCFPILLCQSD